MSLMSDELVFESSSNLLGCACIGAAHVFVANACMHACVAFELPVAKT